MAIHNLQYIIVHQCIGHEDVCATTSVSTFQNMSHPEPQKLCKGMQIKYNISRMNHLVFMKFQRRKRYKTRH